MDDDNCQRCEEQSGRQMLTHEIDTLCAAYRCIDGSPITRDVATFIAGLLDESRFRPWDNLTVERAAMPAEGWPFPSKEYKARKATGCCGRHDVSYRAADGSTWFVGFNFGH